MSYANVSWEVSTGDPQRAIRIGNAAELALAAFNPARLLSTSWLVDTENQNVELVRRALDAVVGSFPQEFFYTVSDQDEADIQGIYPPFAELPGARAITGDARNPLARRQPQPAAAIAAPPVARGRKAAAAARTRRGRKTGRRAKTRQRRTP